MQDFVRIRFIGRGGRPREARACVRPFSFGFGNQKCWHVQTVSGLTVGGVHKTYEDAKRLIDRLDINNQNREVE